MCEPTTGRPNFPTVLHIAGLADLARGSTFDALGRPVVSPGRQTLGSYGSFAETDPDLLHDTWDIWQNAGLRLSVCTVSRKSDRLALERLDQIVGTKFDLLVGGSGMEAKPVWFCISELAELANTATHWSLPPRPDRGGLPLSNRCRNTCWATTPECSACACWSARAVWRCHSWRRPGLRSS